ncbi:unnamed protein product, partial [Brenthis ino]
MLRQILALTVVVISVSGHGRLSDPPSRASMWRYGYSTVPNYDDTGLFCGGFWRHYEINDGKCGICGDAYDLEEPRPHEIGGMYGSGIIVAEYEPGQVISPLVEITAYHEGYWVFMICPDPTSNDQSCFDQYPVELEKGGTKFYPPGTGEYRVSYRLPENLTCDHCVLQWRYVAGNNWGICEDGVGRMGCGNQENFLACADITIKSKIIPVVNAPLILDKLN